MPSQRYSVTPHPVETLLTWVKSGEIAIPEIQRPFVWKATQVRDLLDSLYRGYPVGHLITWRNPKVRLKDGTSASGKRILIDGQQRITALMAALLGHEVVTKKYKRVRMRIAFHPVEETFEVSNPAIRKDSAWIGNIAPVFGPDASVTELTEGYAEKNPEIDRRRLSLTLEKLRNIVHNHVGVIELADDLDIETITKIFVRVNSAGVALSQADFAMSKIAVNESFGGNLLRKAIDYFCHLAVAPEFMDHIEKNDAAFAASEFLPKMRWLTSENDDIYDPSYTDMLRVAFTFEFGRGKLQDLVALLSGRNFGTKEYEEAIAEESFARLRKGVHAYISETHFKRFVMILRSAGFVTSGLIGSKNAVNFAYVLYLRGRAESVPPEEIARVVRRWYAMSVLRGRYAGSPETAFDLDIRQIESRGLAEYVSSVVANELPDSFWGGMLPQLMDTSSASSPYFLCFQAAQVKLGDKGFLSRDITVQDLLQVHGDLHHVYPRDHLKKRGMQRGRYNQIANLVPSQSEINIAIGNTPPETYFLALREQCNGGPAKYGAITDEESLRVNLRMSCIPESMLQERLPSYDEFLEERRLLMGEKLRTWFHSL